MMWTPFMEELTNTLLDPHYDSVIEMLRVHPTPAMARILFKALCFYGHRELVFSFIFYEIADINHEEFLEDMEQLGITPSDNLLFPPFFCTMDPIQLCLLGGHFKLAEEIFELLYYNVTTRTYCGLFREIECARVQDPARMFDFLFVRTRTTRVRALACKYTKELLARYWKGRPLDFSRYENECRWDF